MLQQYSIFITQASYVCNFRIGVFLIYISLFINFNIFLHDLFNNNTYRDTNIYSL
jgi:hypothetical protein